MLGYSINTLTMFGLVLSIGLLVDDAIVVVENVERLMRDEHLSPLDATVRSMKEITGALIGVATVLSAVFLPMAFFSGVDRRDLSPVLDHDRRVDAAVGARRADRHAGDVRVAVARDHHAPRRSAVRSAGSTAASIAHPRLSRRGRVDAARAPR